MGNQENIDRERLIQIIDYLKDDGIVDNVSDFAIKCDFAQPTLSAILNNKVHKATGRIPKVSPSLKEKMIKHFGISPAFIYEGRGPIKESPAQGVPAVKTGEESFDLISKRILTLIQVLGLNPTSFSTRANILQQTTFNIIKNVNYPSYEYLYKVLSTYKEINPDWLILGYGEIKKGTSSELETELAMLKLEKKHLEGNVKMLTEENQTYKSILAPQSKVSESIKTTISGKENGSKSGAKKRN